MYLVYFYHIYPYLLHPAQFYIVLYVSLSSSLSVSLSPHRVSLCSFGCPGTRLVELTEIWLLLPKCKCWAQGMRAWATTPAFFVFSTDFSSICLYTHGGGIHWSPGNLQNALQTPAAISCHISASGRARSWWASFSFSWWHFLQYVSWKSFGPGMSQFWIGRSPKVVKTAKNWSDSVIWKKKGEEGRVWKYHHREIEIFALLSSKYLSPCIFF